MIQNHPNASVTAGTGAAVTLLVYVASLFGLDLPPEVAGAVVTAASFVVLFLGKRRPVS